MPNLACRICGRVVYTTVALDALLPEERRCPRCGAILDGERRFTARRTSVRRSNQPDDPGPPDALERRVAERRQVVRRREERQGGGA